MKIYSYDTQKQKTILCGELIGDTFYKDVEAKHFMVKVGGYGISEDAFQKIKENDCKKIVIRVLNTKYNWESNLEVWEDHCLLANYGSGKQRFLSLKYMSSVKNETD